jgi:hypothetical protein
MTTLRATLLALLLVLFAGSPVTAQNFPILRVGQSVQGSLGADDPTFVEHGRFKVYRFEAAAGETYLLSLRSSAFDTYLFIAWSVGGLTEVLASNDDAGDGTDARLRWRAPASGVYLVVAQSLVSDGMGPYTLTVERAPQPTTAAPQPIAPGQTVTGTLAQTDAVDENDDSFYDSYLLHGRRGQRLRIEMRSDAFDTFLAFGRAGGTWEASATDDDGLGEGTDSRLLVTLPEDGDYVIRANSVAQAAVGPYTLTVSERAALPEPVARALQRGQDVSGSLEEGDPETSDGSLYDLYSFTGRAGERLRLRLESDRFDTYLAFGRGTAASFQEIASNDDAGEAANTNSELEVTLPGDGEYLVRAQALAPGGQGQYRLRLDPTP